MNPITFLRQFKVGTFAIFDILVSYLFVYLIAPLLTAIFRKLHIEIPWVSWLWLTLPIGVLVHVIFRQNTPLNQMFFDMQGNWLVKSILIGMIIVAVSQMKLVR